MNKKFTLIIPILILFIAGCNAASTKKTTKEIDIRTGLNGLTLEFLKNTPPQRIFEGDKFPVIIKVKNVGATDVKENQAVLSLGFEKDYTQNVELLRSANVQLFPGLKTENTATFSLEGRSKVNQKGGEEVISYNLVAGKVDPQSEFHSSTVIATLCYPYQTELDATVCIDTDISGVRPGKKVCKLQDIVFNNGQGAPVAVTKIEVQMLPTQESQIQEGYGKIKPQFLIFVENKGQGTVIRRESVNEFCTKSGTTHKNLNIVYVDVYLSGQKLKCQLEATEGTSYLGHIKLKDKKDIILCAKEDGIQAQDTYLTPLKIILSYGYTQSISANYFIQKTAR